MSAREAIAFGRIVIVGGGCYGSWYLRQLRRARLAGAARWDELIVVDRSADCMVSRDDMTHDFELAVTDWSRFLDAFLDRTHDDVDTGDAIVPSPLMPHLLYDWLLRRARARWPLRKVAVGPAGEVSGVRWQRAADDGGRYVSFADWMCPINCIEPARCPHTGEARDWTMPATVASHVEQSRGSPGELSAGVSFHCTHRVFGVGMIDVRDVLLADRLVAERAAKGASRILVGTVSHCHGALGVLEIEE